MTASWWASARGRADGRVMRPVQVACELASSQWHRVSKMDKLTPCSGTWVCVDVGGNPRHAEDRLRLISNEA